MRGAKALPCGCRFFEDVTTYKRWQRRGYQVRRGQDAVRRVPVCPWTAYVDPTSRRVYGKRTFVRRTAVWCRHQVERVQG